MDLKFSSFMYLKSEFDESAMCAAFGGWKLLLKKDRLLLILRGDKINMPSILGNNCTYHRKQPKVTLKRTIYGGLLWAGIAEDLGAREGLYIYF